MSDIDLKLLQTPLTAIEKSALSLACQKVLTTADIGLLRRALFQLDTAPQTDWTEKPWGRCRTIYLSRDLEVVQAEIKAGGTSSLHYHRHKSNEFYVLAGELLVTVECLDRHQSKRLVTKYSHPFVVCPNERHQFIAESDVLLIETYRAMTGEPIDPQDIVRLVDDANSCGTFRGASPQLCQGESIATH